MELLERINAAEVEAHRLAAPTRQIGPFVTLSSGQQTSLDTAWHDGSRPPTLEELNALKDYCGMQGQSLTLHLLSHRAPACLPVLRQAGLHLEYVLHVYAHDLQVLPNAPALTVTQEGDPEMWAQLSSQGFGKQNLNTMRLVSAHPAIQRFVAWNGPEPVGSAAMQVAAGVAALYGTSTRPEYRNRGMQIGLLAYRLRLAATQGVELASIFVTPDTGSERNIRRAGFKLAGMRLTFKDPV